MNVKIRHLQVLQEKTTVGVRIGSHASVSFGSKFGKFRKKTALFVEQFLRLVASHPAFKILHVIGMFGIHQNRYLVSPEGPLDLKAIDDFRPCPTLG